MTTLTPDWQASFPTAQSGTHLFAEFERRAKAVSAEVLRAATLARAREAILELARQGGVRKAVCAEGPLPKAAGVTEALRGLGMEVYTDPAEIRLHAPTADLGISGVEFGVAETGSCFQEATAIADRLVTILPPWHLVFLPSANIVPGINEAFEIIASRFTRGCVGFLTGPSRTADIERVLTIGVHGPSRFTVIAVDEIPRKGEHR